MQGKAATLFCLLILACVSSQRSFRLVWSDEFNGDTLDKTKWQPEVNCDGGGNNELQCYRSDNVQVQNGALRITARVEDGANGKKYSSGRINTAHAGAWRYGKIDVRVKSVDGLYLWPAIWMMPKDNVYGGWAASGEIDILESRGGYNNNRDFSSALHYGGAWPNNFYQSSGFKNASQSLSSGYHNFTAIWTPETIRFLLDGSEYYRASLLRTFNLQKSKPYHQFGQPFDQKFYIIINLAVGGGIFADKAGALTRDVAKNWKNPTFIIDYVRVYELIGADVTPDCDTMYRNLPCRAWTQDPTQIDAQKMGTTFDWICAQNASFCKDVQSKAKYGKCNTAEKLSWIMNMYYQSVKGEQGKDGCNFSGLGRVVQ
ncbi:glycoside hydrolase family 16 [Planoprotostelium fungivorum]|nr:glycoside hydrolase family 16 [Planoprotostelium fungivorum]